VAVIAASLAALTLTASPAGPAAALTGPSPGTYTGKGFDVYTAQPQALMTAWLASSPYRAVGIYIGGVNRFDTTQALLTPQWVSAQQSAGWHLAPIYLGRQPYCTTSSKKLWFTASDAAAWGRSEATDGVAKARALGLATGSTIFNDIEAYRTPDAACRTAVLTYQSAWTARLHDLGFLSGFYSSLSSGVADQVAVYGSTAYVRPDYLWFARPDGVVTVLNPVIPDSYWVHRRIKQYQSPNSGLPPLGAETWGGKTLAVDRDQFDVAPVPRTAFGDFTGNGWSDLMARKVSTGSLSLYPGNGTRFGSVSRIGAGWNAMSAITRFGDFNRDGHEDLIARQSATGALWLYPGTGSSFTSPVKIGASGWNSMREITPVGDLDGDGYADLVAIQSSTGYLFLYPGRGGSLAARRMIGAGWNAMGELTGVGDFNRDGRVDLLARRTATGELWLYQGAGAGLGAKTLVATGWAGLRDLAGVGDFDRDGFTDLIAVQSSTGKLLRYPGRGTSFGPGLEIGSGWTTDMGPLF
jgi:hypothetical protein